MTAIIGPKINVRGIRVFKIPGSINPAFVSSPMNITAGEKAFFIISMENPGNPRLGGVVVRVTDETQVIEVQLIALVSGGQGPAPVAGSFFKFEAAAGAIIGFRIMV